MNNNFTEPTISKRGLSKVTATHPNSGGGESTRRKKLVLSKVDGSCSSDKSSIQQLQSISTSLPPHPPLHTAMTVSSRRKIRPMMERNPLPHFHPQEEDCGTMMKLDNFLRRFSLPDQNDPFHNDINNNNNNNDSGEMVLVNGQSPQRARPPSTRSSSTHRFKRPELTSLANRSSFHSNKLLAPTEDRRSNMNLRRVVRKTNLQPNGEESLIVVNGQIQDKCARHTIVF